MEFTLIAVGKRNGFDDGTSRWALVQRKAGAPLHSSSFTP